LDTARRPHESVADLHQRIQAQLRARQRNCRNVPENPTSYFKHDPYGVSPLVNRAFREIYPSGSVFKIIDSAAALATGRYTPKTVIPAPNSYWPLRPRRTAPCSAGSTIKTGPCMENFQGETCQNGKTAPLAFAFAKSCNTAFAKLAVKLRGAAIAREAHQFGLDKPYPGQAPPDFCDPPAFRTPLPVCRSTPGSRQDLAEPDTLAQTAIGQQGVGITPLQAAMLSAAVANHGTLMQPYLVQKELGPNLSPLPVQHGGQLAQVLDPTTDQELVGMMHGVVTAPEGTGQAANLPELGSVYVGGKTGTADHCATNSTKCPPPYDWFTGFALYKGEPKIAVAVIIENENGTGGITSAPVAKQVMLAYLRSPAGS
jgi:peptidoglycan glycosyltransferase